MQKLELLLDEIDNDLFKSCLSGNGYYHFHKKGCGKQLVHREVAKRMYGNIDGKIIDHINQNKLDNRRCNLRITNKSGNALNSKIRTDNKTGERCVFNHKGGYMVRIKRNNVNKYIGFYKRIEDAIMAKHKYMEENLCKN